MVQTGNRKMKRLLVAVFVTFIVGWLGAGCASYNQQTKDINQNWESGYVQSAATQVSAEAEKRKETKDAVIWRLEQGAVLRAAGQLEESNHAFDIAEEMMNRFEEKAKVKVSHETLASVTNLTTLPYEGFAYDKIMMNTYKALNYLELGDYEKARVEFNRAYERQDEAVHVNAARIEKALEEGKGKNLNVDLEDVYNDGRFRSQFENNYANLEQFKAYADYVNPLSVYLDALFFMTRATGFSDLERSRKSFERVLGMMDENKFIHQDLETIQQVIEGQPIPATTYVFFETGLAPEREQIRIDLPLFIVTPQVPYVGAAFPKLKYRNSYLSDLHVSCDEMTESTTLLSNMDAVVTHEFKNVLPLIITRTLIASAIKAGATYGAYAGMTNGGRNNPEAGLAVLITGAITQVAMNQADLRTWTTLPKEFQLCRFSTPANREIELTAPDCGQKIPVLINEGVVNVIWVKSVNRNSPLLVKQFTLLKDNAKGNVPFEIPASRSIPLVESSQPEQPTQKSEQTDNVNKS